MSNEVEEVKARIDLVDLVSQYVQVKKAGANYKAVCPFHQEKTPSLMVSPTKQIWKCFGCQKGGDVYRFVMEAEHLEFGDALRILAQKAGVTLQPRTAAEHQTQNRKDRLFRINSLASRIFQKVLLDQPQGKAALAYLKKRGLSEETIKRFYLGFASRGISLKDLMIGKGAAAADLSAAGSPERFFERVIFPIYDVLGNVVGFTGRALGDIQPKYLNSPETPIFNKSRVLYGLNLAKKAIVERDQVVLVEGQMDVIALHQGKIENTVASSGTAITETQLLTLSKYTNNFLLAFDNDTAGVNTTKKVIEMLTKFDLNCRVIDFAPYKDAGELFEKDPAAWAKAIKAAKEGFDWWLEREIAANQPTNFIENKKKITKAMLPLLSITFDPTRRDYAVSRLAQALEVKTGSVYASLEKLKPAEVEAAAPAGQIPTHLLPEEQLLALVLGYPTILEMGEKRFKEVVWQSEETEQIASSIETCYNDKALVKNQLQFHSKVKNSLNTLTAEKIDSWQFWLSQTWPNLDDKLAAELFDEKIGLLSSKSREKEKESLAIKIRQAQEKGDIEGLKKLMNKLTNMSKETSSMESND
ncbi:MAG TPA: DNA primase [Candidatus Saccharimonadales bacterium]|nr:DNA primase [Candidatus Saccharimonadales bacterium]